MVLELVKLEAFKQLILTTLEAGLGITRTVIFLQRVTDGINIIVQECKPAGENSNVGILSFAAAEGSKLFKEPFMCCMVIST
jgi:hypothetical protein